VTQFVVVRLKVPRTCVEGSAVCVESSEQADGSRSFLYTTFMLTPFAYKNIFLYRDIATCSNS